MFFWLVCAWIIFYPLSFLCPHALGIFPVNSKELFFFNVYFKLKFPCFFVWLMIFNCESCSGIFLFPDSMQPILILAILPFCSHSNASVRLQLPFVARPWSDSRPFSSCFVLGEFSFWGPLTSLFQGQRVLWGGLCPGHLDSMQLNWGSQCWTLFYLSYQLLEGREVFVSIKNI